MILINDYLSGKLYYKLGHIQTSLDILTRAAEDDGNNRDKARKLLGKIYYDKKFNDAYHIDLTNDYVKGDAFYLKYYHTQRNKMNNDEIRLNIAMSYYKPDDKKNNGFRMNIAEEWLLSLIDKNSKDVLGDALYLMAHISSYRDNASLASDYFTKAIAVLKPLVVYDDNNNPLYKYYIGVSYGKLGEIHEYKGEYQLAKIVSDKWLDVAIRSGYKKIGNKS